MRAILAILVVLGACTLSFKFGAHHTSDSVFEELYLHLVPAPLVKDNHAEHGHLEPLLEFPLPAFLGAETPLGSADWQGRVTDQPKGTIYNLQIFQVASVLLCLILLSGVPRHLEDGKGDRLTRMFAGFCQWIRDEMVVPIMGKTTGQRFLPYFLSIFFFIFFMNVMGLVPGSATATASIYVTAALALTTFVGMIACGMIAQGPGKFWVNLVPHVPWWLWPLMLAVEVVGLLVKPFALMVRLFANMSGGHMVVLSFMGLFFFMAQLWGTAGGWGAMPIGVGFAVFIMIIESFVAMLQAYIFTQLSIMFVYASVHPEH